MGACYSILVHELTNFTTISAIKLLRQWNALFVKNLNT